MSSFRLRNRQNPLQGTIAERELARIDAGLPLNPSKKPGTTQKRSGRSRRARGSTGSRNSTQTTSSSNLRGLVGSPDTISGPTQQDMSSNTINRQRKEEKKPLPKLSRFSIRKNVLFNSVTLIDNEGDLSKRFNFTNFWEYQTKKAQNYAKKRRYTLFLVRPEVHIKYSAKDRPEHHELPVLGSVTVG